MKLHIASKRPAALWFAPRPLAYGLGAFSFVNALALWGKALGYPYAPDRRGRHKLVAILAKKGALAQDHPGSAPLNIVALRDKMILAQKFYLEP